VRVLIDSFGCGNAPLLKLAGAERGTYLHTDERTAVPEEIKAYQGKPELLKAQWYDVGLNHRVENGHGIRELEYNGWFIEVGSLADLYELMQTSGSRLAVEKSPERLFVLETDD
jgi:hypothetical protein